jgi:RHS repeat-associated protein
LGPRLGLRYDTAAGTGPFGQGVIVPLPRLVLSLLHGFPRYDGSDTLLLEGVGEVVVPGNGTLRPQVDQGEWRIATSGEGYRLRDRQGLQYVLGTSPAARLSDVDGPVTRVWAWQLERIEDALGNAVDFGWLRDGRQLYLETVSYGAYLVRFQYGPRPDVARWGRAGFLVQTALRCETIELQRPATAQPLLRRWSLSYRQDEANGASLLTGVQLTGVDAAGGELTAPPLTLDYTRFAPRELTRFAGSDPRATAPGPLTRPDRRVELVDWNGDGLPDLVEIAGGGRARVWPNLGDCTWGPPQTVGPIPRFASPRSAVAFVDMNGDGSADLIGTSDRLSGFVPRTAQAGFQRPVAWSRTPAPTAGSARTRLLDLDGDGMVDMLDSTSDFLTLYYRRDPEGWSSIPQTVPRSVVDVSLADRHVFTADMTGDGTADLVRVSGAGVVYWPYLGLGRWDAPVVMQTPPELPFDVRPERLFLSDVDGDGCADLLYLDGGRLRYWINQGGVGFGEEREIAYLPTAQMADIRIADMRGTGTPGILWSVSGPLGRAAAYFYLDLGGRSRPHLLASIDNGVGLTVSISYSSSAEAAAVDARAGRPWSTTLPVVVPVVSAITASDAATGRTSTTRITYHDGRYDGILREFAGFARVDEDQVGDATAPTLRTTSSFYIGLVESTGQEPATLDDHYFWRALRGRLRQQERYGLDGSAQESLPFHRLAQQWTVLPEATSGGTIYHPRLTASSRSVLERQAMAAAVVSTDNLAFSNDGDVLLSREVASAADPALTRVIQTSTQVAADPSGRFWSRPFRMQQRDGAGNLLADTITEYDGAPEGTIGAQGLITGRSALVLTDELAAAIFGANPPDFAALGYFRRPGEDGWWIDLARYARIEDAAGLHGRITDPLGTVTAIDFDPDRTYPAALRDARGNTVQAAYDYRTARAVSVTDASGAPHTAGFDALARVVALVEPGDTDVLPTVAYAYDPAARPVERVTRHRAESGAGATIDTRELFDGFDVLLERRTADEAGEIAAASFVYSARGLLARSYLEFRPASASYALPGDALPHVKYTYDALGRPTRVVQPDGRVRTVVYGGDFTLQSDEEDNRTDPGATHAGTPTRTTLDATGRPLTIEQNLAGRAIVSRYQHDEKGNLVAFTDALGNTTRLSYDLLGRRLRVNRPECTTVTVLDAAGNPVESRNADGTRVLRAYDGLRRLTSVRLDPAGAVDPVAAYTYHDAGEPPPPDAGLHTVGGRCVRIDDEGGSTIFDYDARGHVALKRYRPAGVGSSYDLDFTYRADERLSSITYPDGGAGRTTLDYQYDARGLVAAVPGLVESFAYDLAARRVSARYANGVEHAFSYDDPSARLTGMQLVGPAGILRALGYQYDAVGNITSIGSPDASLAASYTYDDLYRLVAATTGGGEAWTYAYDDAGNFTFRSDVGSFAYGERGAPATCLTTAGVMTFDYDPNGAMQATPWGALSFDPLGCLRRVLPSDGSERSFTYDHAGVRVAELRTGIGTPPFARLTPDALFDVENGVLVLNLFDGLGTAAREPVGAARLYLHSDHLGSLALVTDTLGQTVESRRYDPFGVQLPADATAAVPLGFTGGAPDPGSGLLYLHARYYHPAIGRFISVDPVIGDAGRPIAWNAYAYCGDNPVNLSDPLGQSPEAALTVMFGILAASVVFGIFAVAAEVPLAMAMNVEIGIASGGLAAGVTASNRGGALDDVLSATLVGAAVGGLGAFLAASAANAIASPIVDAKSGGLLSLATHVTAGMVSGGINGIAQGLAVGLAGPGHAPLHRVLASMWAGMVVGQVTGAIAGGFSYQFGHGNLVLRVEFKTDDFWDTLAGAAGKLLLGTGAALGMKLYQQGAHVEAKDVLGAVAFGLVAVGFGTFFNIQKAPESTEDATQAAGKASVAIPSSVNLLSPKMLGVTSSAFSAISTATYLVHSPINPAAAAYVVLGTHGY